MTITFSAIWTIIALLPSIVALKGCIPDIFTEQGNAQAGAAIATIWIGWSAYYIACHLPW